MQREAERLVLFYDLNLESYSVARRKGYSASGLTPKPIQTLLEWVKHVSDNGPGRLAWKRQDGREVVYLADIEVDPSAGHATLLINRCDKRASDVIFFNPDNDERRRIRREPGEGADYSSHVLVLLKPQAPNQYLILVEQSPGLSGGRVEAFLNYLFRAAGSVFKEELVARHPGGLTVNGKPYNVRMRHRCKMNGHPSRSFVSDLEKGELGQIELISEKHKNDPWDAHGYIVEKARVVKVGQAGTGVVGSKMAAIRDLCGVAVRHDYENVKVRFTTPTDQKRTITLDAQTQGLAKDSLYVRRETIEGFNESLPSAFEKINKEIREKMKAIS